MSSAVADYLFSLLGRQAAVFAHLAVNPIVHTHRWKNGESKSVIDPLLVLSTEDLYWAERYPFCGSRVQCSDPSDGLTLAAFPLVADLTPRSDTPLISLDPNSVGVLISHVNHFGHFVLDTLPMLLWLKVSCRACRIHGLNTGLSDNILKEYLYLSYITDTRASGSPQVLDLPDHCRVSNAMSLHSSSPLFSQYLLRKAKALYSRASIVSRTSIPASGQAIGCRRFFVTRGGRGSSRIHNYNEIVKLLIEHGFCPIDLRDYTVQQTVAILSKASVIVAECGTSSHLSAMLSASTSRVLSLVPERLFRLDDHSAIYGCLSYYCGYLDKASFVFGRSIIIHPIPTSDIAYYSPGVLLDTLNKFHL